MMQDDDDDDDMSLTERDATIMLGQGKKAKTVWPGQSVYNVLTTCCALVVALYEGHTSVSCYHWPALSATDGHIGTFLKLTRGKTLRKVVIITNGIRCDADRELRMTNSTEIRRRVGCLVEYYTINTDRDRDPYIRIQADGELTRLDGSILFRTMP